MKIFYNFFLLILLNQAVTAQTPGWLWAVSSQGGNNYQYSEGISASPSGDIYMTGRLSGTVTIGGVPASGGGAQTVFNARFNKDGQFAWVSPYAFSGGYDYPFGFTRDNHDNSYSTGTINSGAGLYVDKYNPAGAMVWKKEIYSYGCGSNGVVTDKEGNVYITGGYNSASGIDFGVTTLTTVGGDDIFIAKFDSNANCIWAVSAGGSSNDFAKDITIDHDGNIYICGGYTSAITFGSISAPAATSYSNYFITKYDPNGTALWVALATGAGILNWWEQAAITIDSCDNLYVTGHFQNTVQFGSLPSITSAGNDDIFVAKCLNNGQWEWVKSAGGPGPDEGISIALDNRTDVYVAGTFQNTIQFGSTTLTSVSGNLNDLFVANFANSTGDLQWVIRGGGTADDNASGVTVDTNRFVYLTGGYNGTATYGTSTINGSVNGNSFVVKLDTVPRKDIIVHQDSSYCAGISILLPYSIVGTFNSGNIFTAQLSDMNGSFISPVNLGSVTATSDGTIPITIPSGTPNGNYLIRIISSNPAYSSHSTCRTVLVKGIISNDASLKISDGLSMNISADTTVCPGSPVQLLASGGTDYSWSSSAQLSCYTCNNPVASPAASSTYVVNVSNGFCSAKDSVIIQIGNGGVEAGSVSALRDTICSGTPGVLSVSGSNGDIRWQSSVTGTDFSPIPGETNTSYLTIPPGTTYYRTVAGSGFCADTSSAFKLVVAPSPVADFEYDETNLQIAFTNKSSGATIYSWDFGDSTTSQSVNPKHGYFSKGTYHVCLTVYNGSNCSFTICRDIDVIDGIQSIHQSSDFKIYPSPFSDYLFIHAENQLQKPEQIQLYDVLGRIVLDKYSDDGNFFQLDVKSLQAGVYFLNINTSTTNYIYSVVKH